MKTFLLLFLSFPLLLSAAVKVSISGQTAVLENNIVRAEFSAVGGKLVKFTAFKNGKNLTGDSKDGKGGALKDFFAPRDFTLNTAEFTIKSNQLADGSAELILTAPALKGEWNFINLTKAIRLAPGSSRLDVTITISNKLERMAPWLFTYWSHNFLGVPDEDNNFIYADKTGIRSAIPSSEKNTRDSRPIADFTRNFLAMLGTKTRLGVVMLPEFSETDLIYSWYCKGVNKYDTIEFRLISDKVVHGSSITKKFSLAAVSQLDTLSGAGKTGAGSLKNTSGGVELALTGFETVKETFQIYIDGKKKGSFTASLAPGKLFKRDLGNAGKHFRAVSKNFDMELKRDENGKLLPLALKPSAPKRKAELSEADTKWQFDPKGDVVTPHYVWQNGGKVMDVLFLVPTDGVRDIIELAQRFKIKYTAPTVFPGNWHLSWRTTTDMHRPSNGLDRLGPYLKKRYNAIVIGANAGVPKARHGKGSWSSYPEKLRKQFLQMASKGAGLVIINPGKKDPMLNAVSKKLTDFKKTLSLTADLTAAPFFEKSVIRAGNYGKGKIVIADFERDAFIAPHPGYRGNLWAAPRPDHRYQEYQFALIGQLLQWSCGAKPVLTAVAADAEKLLVTANAAVKGKIEIFDRFTNSYHSQTAVFKAGKNTITLPRLRHGKNYIHVTEEKGSSGYAVIEGRNSNFIKNITIVNNGTSVKGTVETAAPLKKAETLQLQVLDNLGRIIFEQQGKGNTFSFAPEKILTNRHTLTAKILENGRLSSESRKDFYLPRLRNTTANYTNMLWLCGDSYPEYSYFYRYKQYSAYGFNYHYSGSGNNGMLNFIRFSDEECGSNGHGGSNIFYFPGLHDSLKKYTQTHDKKYLVRGRCPNDPQFKAVLESDHVSEKIKDFATRYIFQLGDEMSMTFHQATFDVCMCHYCMADFRNILKKKYKTLARLNSVWDCKFKTWDEVLPLTFQEAMFKDNRAGFVEHRLYMDEVFRRTLNGYRTRLRKKFPNSLVGPTGVNGFPWPYGGNFNFYSMKDFDCSSFYRDTRLPVSFNRDRLVMRFRGYSTTEPETVYSFWEGLALGERGNNNWCGPTYLLPDLRFSPVRSYYSKLLWELRSGAGDLLYHSRKITDTAAILHSQTSLIINFTKQRKTEFYAKEKNFARMLEDMGVPYRFIAPQQLNELDKFKVLILPESSAISDSDAAKIAEFVKKGGLLIADVEPGTFDGAGNKRKTPVLDKVFGINSASTSLRKIKTSSFKKLQITHAGRGVKAVTAKSSGSAKLAFGKAPLFLENHFGKGRTLLLNFVCDYTEDRFSASAREFLSKIEKFMRLPAVPGRTTAPRPVLHGAFADGLNRYFVLLPEIRNKEKFDNRFTAPFVLAEAAHLYDVRRGKYLGKGTKFTVQLNAGNGTMLAALPYKVNSVAVKAPAQIKRGSTFTLEAEVKTSGKTGAHVLLLTCTDPQGKDVAVYRQIVKTSAGKHRFTVPAAFNDLPGVWQFTVKDAASGVKAKAAVKFK